MINDESKEDEEMKKRILSMTLALVMVLALLPFAALAAEDYDLSPYAEVLEGAGADVFGTYYDLDGDQSPELLLTRGDAESFAVDIYTLADGAPGNRLLSRPPVRPACDGCPICRKSRRGA